MFKNRRIAEEQNEGLIIRKKDFGPLGQKQEEVNVEVSKHQKILGKIQNRRVLHFSGDENNTKPQIQIYLVLSTFASAMLHKWCIFLQTEDL